MTKGANPELRTIAFGIVDGGGRILHLQSADLIEQRLRIVDAVGKILMERDPGRYGCVGLSPAGQFVFFGRFLPAEDRREPETEAQKQARLNFKPHGPPMALPPPRIIERIPAQLDFEVLDHRGRVVWENRIFNCQPEVSDLGQVLETTAWGDTSLFDSHGKKTLLFRTGPHQGYPRHAWSPDGAVLLIQSDGVARCYREGVHVYDFNTTPNEVSLLGVWNDCSAVLISKAGQLAILEPSGTAAREIPIPIIGPPRELALGPDGDAFAFIGGNDIFVLKRSSRSSQVYPGGQDEIITAMTFAGSPAEIVLTCESRHPRGTFLIRTLRDGRISSEAAHIQDYARSSVRFDARSKTVWAAEGQDAIRIVAGK